MFAKREPDALRAKLASLREEARLGRISEDAFVQLSIEILLALQKLGEPLSAEEQKTLRVHHENRDAYVENTGNLFCLSLLFTLASYPDDVARSAISLASGKP